MVNNIAQWLVEASKKLQRAFQQGGVGTGAQQEAQYLLCRYLDVDRSHLIAHPEQEISAEDETILAQWLAKRCVHMPLAYICGTAYFYQHEFIIRQHALIPRADTEILLALLHDVVPNCQIELMVLELASGSGALGLSVGYDYPNASLTLTDIDADNCQLIADNQRKIGLKNAVKIICSDWCASLPQEKYQVILCNPPYIKQADIALLSASVRDFEPGLALDGGADGMACYRVLNQQLPDYMADNADVIVEIGDGQLADVQAVMQNFKLCNVKHDLSHIVRGLHFKKK